MISMLCLESLSAPFLKFVILN